MVGWSDHPNAEAFEDQIIDRMDYERQLRFVLRGLSPHERAVLGKKLREERLTATERKTLSRLRAKIHAAKPPL